MENYAIILALKGIDFKDRNFEGIFLGKEVTKTISEPRSLWPPPNRR